MKYNYRVNSTCIQVSVTFEKLRFSLFLGELLGIKRNPLIRHATLPPA